MMLTPKDRRTVLNALVDATAHIHDRIAACPVCRGRKACPACEEALDRIAEYDGLGGRMRAAQP